MMRYNHNNNNNNNNNTNNQYDLRNSHQHLFESTLDGVTSSAAVCGAAVTYALKNRAPPNSSAQQNQSHPDDLTVCGYSCNLYRDDFTAMRLESNSHLLPWNGDHTLLIDRYDCRGYLYDLAPYDADVLRSSAAGKNSRQTSEEVEIERLCDHERYATLNELINLDDSNKDQDEDEDDGDEQGSRNLYGSVKFKYESDSPMSRNNSGVTRNGEHSHAVTAAAATSVNSSSSSTQSNGDSCGELASERAFTPSENLKLPVGMLTPETIKMNQIIVKTAGFVAKQGLQMEILLKAKQAANSQFDFLNYDNQLNPYYKHVQQLIRTNQIDPTEFLKDESSDQSENGSKGDANDDNDQQIDSEHNSENSDDDDDDDDDASYLHPLLNQSRLLATTPANKPTTQQQYEAAVVAKEKSDNTNGECADASAVNVTLIADVSQNQASDDEPIASATAEQPSTHVATATTTAAAQEPTGADKIMIDKLAEYVARNGIEFETNIRNKNDARFDFLNEPHEFHRYYRAKIEEHAKAIKRESSAASATGASHTVKRRSRKETSRSPDVRKRSESSETDERKRDDKNSKKKKSKKTKRHRHRSSSSSSCSSSLSSGSRHRQSSHRRSRHEGGKGGSSHSSTRHRRHHSNHRKSSDSKEKQYKKKDKDRHN